MDKVAIIEGLLFISGEDGIEYNDIQKVLDLSSEEFESILEQLKEIYASSSRGLTIEKFGCKIRITTKKEHQKYYEQYFGTEKEDCLSPAALEVLAIIAYNQPVTRSMIDDIRGVSSSHHLRRLLSKNLIESKGKSDLPGKPNFYGTTDCFLNYFGLNSIDQLPKIDFDDNVEESDLYESKYNEDIEMLDDL